MRGIIRDNSNNYDGSEIEERNEDENIGVEGSAQLTLVNSHLLTLNTLLITYRPLIVFTISQNIQHNIVPINVAININPVSI